MRRLPQTTSVVVMLKVFLSSDHLTAATGKTVAIVISKNGGAFANPNVGALNATEVANGWYKVTLDTTDTSTTGDLVIRGTATACDDSEQIAQIVNANNAGLAALPNAAAEASGGLYTRGTGAGQINQDANGRVDANAKAWAGTATTLSSGVPDVNIKTITTGIIAAGSFAANALDAVWSTTTRLLSAGTNIVLAKGTGITGLNDLDAAGVRGAVGLASANTDTQLAAIASYIDTEVGAIKAKTDNLPSDPADASDIAAAFSTVNSTLAIVSGYIDTEVAAIKAKTDNLPSAPAAVGDIPTAIQNADALLDRANGIETGLTPRNALRLNAAVLAGKVSGGGTGTETFRNAVADSKNRLIVTDDSSGNRSAITLDLT